MWLWQNWYIPVAHIKHGLKRNGNAAAAFPKSSMESDADWGGILQKVIFKHALVPHPIINLDMGYWYQNIQIIVYLVSVLFFLSIIEKKVSCMSFFALLIIFS